ncbi:2258_t:CDS:2 [Cetraspora pellucida]|uniref:2258_t:CDS:1 n=1 Tax=Cetraspora pellucida TaxID=1433469 RepID=A0A9N9JI15_9GLOM|nr:2258_t:CDS:2 [Cetraspora pellucida]
MDKIYQIHSFSADSISKMTNKDIQYIIDNISFDYSIKIEESKIRCFTSPTLKSEFSELSSGSDQQISYKKENKNSEFSEKKVSVPDDEDSNYDYDEKDFSNDNNEDDDKDDRSFSRARDSPSLFHNNCC